MFVNYFITIYLHNYIVSILFAYYYTACIIIIIILFRDTQSCAARSYLVRNFFGSEEASASYVSASRIRPRYNQSLFYRVTHLIADTLRHHDSKIDGSWMLAIVVPRRCIATISYRKVIVIREATVLSAHSAVFNPLQIETDGKLSRLSLNLVGLVFGRA